MADHNRFGRLCWGVLWFLGMGILLHPLFFVIYRLSVFNTVPRDDYAPFLLWLVGQPGGAFPVSPYGYRILSMVAAAPLYWLPPIQLTNTPADLSFTYLKATAALSGLAFLGIVAAAWLNGALSLRAGLERQHGLLAAALTVALMFYVQITAIDPLAVAMIAAGVALIGHRRPFALLMALSVPTNEKVALVLAIWLLIRCALSREDRRAYLWQAGAALAAVLAYFALVRLIQLPGNAYQLDPGNYPATLRENLAAYATSRGLLLNVVPILVLAVLALFGRPIGIFRRADILVIPALAVVALFLTQLFQAGRIVMHAAPLFVTPAMAALSTRITRLPC